MEDKRIGKTKNDLKEAIIQLVKIKNISDVSVSELCNKAGINRNTFYCHYHYPEEVLEEVFSSFLHDLLTPSLLEKSSYETVKEACDYLKEHKELSIVISSDNCNGIFERKMNDFIYKRSMKHLTNEKGPYNERYYNYISIFLINGSISIMKEWINNGFKESNEEIASLISELCNYGTHKGGC